MKGAKKAKLVITAEKFQLFKQIAKKIIALAMKKPNCSPVISWFNVYLDEMKASSITYDSLETFFRSFPDIQHVNELPEDERSLVKLNNDVEYILMGWIREYPQISESREAFLRVPSPEILRIDYNYEISNSSDAATALKDYIETGDLIRSQDANYDDSILYELEYFIEKRRDEIEKYLEPDTLPDGKDILKHTFIALVAPSMEGKTQSAFVFKRMRPLYFLMPEATIDADKLQPIYQNFTGLSRALQDFADMDVKDIVKSIKKSSKPTDFMQSISAGELNSTYKTAKFRVLGFLMALIEDSEAKYKASSKSWMEFHATQSRNLTFEAKSLADFKKLKRKRAYFLYLDEFEASDSNVFVRNIIRAASMTVLVANTNTNLANLVGKKQASNSREGPERVWSLVVTHLNPLNEKILDKMFPKLEAAMSKLKAKVVPRDLQVLDAFFDNFKGVQVPQMRPGFVRVIVDIILKFQRNPENSTFSFDKFFDDIINNLATFLSARKPNVKNDIEGKLGSKALFLRNAYGSTQTEPLPEIYHRKNYLNFHFYYLTNPVGDSNWFFCTFSPAPIGTNASKGDVKNYIRYKDMNSDMVDWITERTFFKLNEVMPLLSFMGIWHEDSIAQVFDEGKLLVDSSPGGTGDVPNTEETYRSTGNELEVLSTVCLLDASHRNVDEKKLTFTGQGGRSFLTNLIKNLIVAPSSRCRKDIEVVFSNRFGDFLDRMHVPFLYPANLALPGFFQTNFTDCEGFNSRSVHFGPFRRIPNYDMIDCKFSFFLKSDDPSSSIPSSAVAAVECKCWENALALYDVVRICGKARRNAAKFCVVICKSASEGTPETRYKCNSKGWVVLKVQKTGIILADGTTRTIFSFKNFDSLIKIPAEIKMTCLVLELDEINRKITDYTIVNQ